MLRHEFNGIYLINISYINESYIKYILDADTELGKLVFDMAWQMLHQFFFIFIKTFSFFFSKYSLVWSILDLTVSLFVF